MAATNLDKKLQLRNLIASGEAKRIRENAGITLEDVAGEVGVHYMTVWRWENRHRSPRGEDVTRYLSTLNRIAAAMEREPAVASAK